jgi:8-oxo-dGTP pyrophosphatase MutT (NUDIX family)
MVTQIIKKVQVWVVRYRDENKFEALLLKTVEGRGGFWQPVTGKVEEGESILAGAVRELAEETGIQAETCDLIDIKFEFQFQGRWGPAIETVFLLKPIKAADSGEILLDNTEHVEYAWMDVNEALGMLYFESNLQALWKIIKEQLASSLKNEENKNGNCC